MTMRATALVLFVAMLFPTAAAAFAPPAAASCCCKLEAGASCPMKNARSCGMQSPEERTAVVPLVGEHRPAVLIEIKPASVYVAAESFGTRVMHLATRLVNPPDSPPPKPAG